MVKLHINEDGFFAILYKDAGVDDPNNSLDCSSTLTETREEALKSLVENRSKVAQFLEKRIARDQAELAAVKAASIDVVVDIVR
jgi:hypothetical protein